MTAFGAQNCETNLWKKRLNALALRRGYTRISRTCPSASIARLSQCVLPRIVITTSSTCGFSFGSSLPWRTQFEKCCPKSDRFSGDNHAARCKKVFNNCRTQKTIVRSNRVSNNLAGVAEAFQAQHLARNVHGADIACSNPANKLMRLAVPPTGIAMCQSAGV